MGKIQLVGIEVMARIGLLEEEQYAPQDLLVSLDLSYDFESIKISDEIQNVNEKLILSKLQTIPQIITSYAVDPLKIKSKDHLIF